MYFSRQLWFIAAMLALAPALAIDPGVARGELTVDGRTIALTHAYAHQHDNEERLLDGRELRILLTDREIPHTLLSGVSTSVLDDLARKGAVQGVLLTVDPARPTVGLRGVLLIAEPGPAKPLVTFSKVGGDGGFPKLEIGGNRVHGNARHLSARTGPTFAYAATFSAPLFREEPIRDKFTGAKALQSAPFGAFTAYRKALAAGDLEAARRHATPERFRALAALLAQTGQAEAPKLLRAMSALPAHRDKPQVFVRGSRALIVYQADDGRVLQPMLHSGGYWLVD